MRIIDADSHFQEPVDWLQQADPKLAGELPMMSAAEMFVDVIVGDLFSSIPPNLRPDPRSLVPPEIIEGMEKHMRGGDGEVPQFVIDAGALSPAACEAEARLAWLDARGIEAQIILPTLGYHPYRAAVRAERYDLALRALHSYNSWAAERLHGHTDRLIPAAVIDLVDVDWSIAEMQRMRDKGSRAVFVKADPAGNKSLSHPDFERFWSAAEDMGVVIMFHVGGGRAPMHPGWANDGGNIPAFYRLAGIAREQVPQMTLAAMIFGGVLERHPRLKILVSELGIAWLPHFLETIDLEADNNRPRIANMTRYELPMKPSEYFQRQIRLSVVHQQDALHPTIDRVPPGLIVFASDFPHIEGSQDAVAIYGAQMAGADQASRARFFGGEAAEMLGI